MWNLRKQHPEDPDGIGKTSIHVRLDRSTSFKDLSGGELAFTSSIGAKFRVLQVLIHSSTGLNDKTITVTLNSGTGANYDTKLGEVDFDGTQDVGLLAGDNLLGAFGDETDEIIIVSSGATVVGILYVTLMVELLG